MWKEIRDCYRAKSWRVALVDTALVCFIIATLALTRCLFVFIEEVHQFRVDFNTQAIAARTAIQLGVSALSGNLNDLNVTGKVITYRIDAQSTSLKALIANATKQSQVSSQQEMKTTRDAIKDSINDTKQVLQTVADQTTDAVKKPLQVNVQTPKTVDTPPTVTVQIPPTPTPEKHKRGAWSKVWHFIFHLKE